MQQWTSRNPSNASYSPTSHTLPVLLAGPWPRALFISLSQLTFSGKPSLDSPWLLGAFYHSTHHTAGLPMTDCHPPGDQELY